MGDSVTVGIGSGFAFAPGFPVTLCSTFFKRNGMVWYGMDPKNVRCMFIDKW